MAGRWPWKSPPAPSVDPAGTRRDRGRQLAPGEVEKVRRELAGYREFAVLAGQIVEANEAISEARQARH